jgi:DNA (cytosine-5)-methyltransferase 1
MKHGSLFSGIGGFDLGFERAGIETVWQIEIDPFCRKVLEKHWPNVQRFEDIRECRVFPWCDIISGGFPCQDVSKAGSRAGIAEGTRSGLWIEMLRVIRTVRPSIVVVENVSGLLERGIGRVLGDLAESGFDAEWDCLPAYTFGAPQPRDRVFVVAYSNRERHLHGEAGRLPTEAGMQALSNIRPSCNARFLRGQGESNGEIGEFERFREPAIYRVCDGIPAELDESRLRSLGNAIVPQIAEWLGKRILECERKNPWVK